jgi:hypothetical protein
MVPKVLIDVSTAIIACWNDYLFLNLDKGKIEQLLKIPT